MSVITKQQGMNKTREIELRMHHAGEQPRVSYSYNLINLLFVTCEINYSFISSMIYFKFYFKIFK